ncbi:alpha/beta hydrolase [Chitinophaga silvatica]|uniref:Alpha/beta hydrolase n=1 Tax=Chitinophaga silvatica TaxID=2282649 RepID=A0A3E1YGB5_9BACT|nr:alpha/beta hydrolase [Chitinophaga silvatica]RFS26418.1 alpha/beta hydrolase [Chitinophaga silvatica]
MELKVLTLPGLNGSGPTHWQSVWENTLPGILRIEQSNWDTPVRSEWVATVEQVVAASGPDVVIAAHSLGCITMAHWAAQTKLKIRAALLVAPADAERPGFPPEATGFSPIPLMRLPFKSIVVASNNDPYCKLERAMYFAENWGSRFVNVGAKGHINSQSGLGDWQEGQHLLEELIHNWPTL